MLAVGGTLLLPAGRHQWALSLFRQPTRYTVLAFSRAWELPTIAIVNKPITVSFTVGNHEGHAVSYRYVLSSAGGGSPRILGESTRTVAAGSTWSVSTVIRPHCQIAPCRIEVALPGHPEVIEFLASLKTQKGEHA